MANLCKHGYGNPQICPKCYEATIVEPLSDEEIKAYPPIAELMKGNSYLQEKGRFLATIVALRAEYNDHEKTWFQIIESWTNQHPVSQREATRFLEKYAVKKAEQIRADRKRIEELEKWVDDLQTGMYINCVYCGHRYPPGTASVKRKVLYEHIKVCPKHPLSEATQRITAQAATIERMEGEIKERDDLLTEVIKMDLDIRIQKTIADFYERQCQALGKEE